VTRIHGKVGRLYEPTGLNISSPQYVRADLDEISVMPAIDSALTLDLRCGACARAGDAQPPQLAMFAYDPTSGHLFVATFLYGKERVRPARVRRADGGITYAMACQHGHNPPTRHETIVGWFDDFGDRRQVQRLI
jgi:hypothetical protein